MAEKTLSVPAIKVNNDVIGLVPNSFSYKSGDGEVKVRAASTGGGNAKAIHSEDAESKFSTVKFTIHPTPANMERIRDWKASIGGNTIEAVQRGNSEGIGDFSLSFRGMSLTNDPDIKAAVDGVIDIEMAGDKLE